VAQVWRDGRRQVTLATLLASAVVEVEPLEDIARLDPTLRLVRV